MGVTESWNSAGPFISGNTASTHLYSMKLATPCSRFAVSASRKRDAVHRDVAVGDARVTLLSRHGQQSAVQHADNGIALARARTQDLDQDPGQDTNPDLGL